MAKERVLEAPRVAGMSAEHQRADTAGDSNDQVTRHFRQYGKELHRLLVNRFGNAEGAKDVVQETFLRLHLTLAEGSSIDDPWAWLVVVSNRLVLSEQKHTGRWNRSLATLFLHRWRMASAPTPEELLAWRQSDQQRAAALRDAMATLSPLQKAVLQGRAGGLDIRQIAELVGLKNPRRVSEIIQPVIRRLQERCREK
jgi:RNA polymerase sigma factor (sigma-70 family)